MTDENKTLRHGKNLAQHIINIAYAKHIPLTRLSMMRVLAYVNTQMTKCIGEKFLYDEFDPEYSIEGMPVIPVVYYLYPGYGAMPFDKYAIKDDDFTITEIPNLDTAKAMEICNGYIRNGLDTKTQNIKNEISKSNSDFKSKLSTFDNASIYIGNYYNLISTTSMIIKTVVVTECIMAETKVIVKDEADNMYVVNPLDLVENKETARREWNKRTTFMKNAYEDEINNKEDLLRFPLKYKLDENYSALAAYKSKAIALCGIYL